MRPGLRSAVALGAALLLGSAARAADKEAILRAVDQGVAYLKATQAADGTWSHEKIGATALCGLALLESEVKPTDPAVQKAAKAVREASIRCTDTYSLSLMIMFLDVLADPADAELIDSMAVRLLAGQEERTGGWTYQCPALSDAESHRLQAALGQRNELVARTDLPPASNGRPTVADLPPAIRQQLQLAAQPATSSVADNSNTQFAVLALWVARRKGIPVDAAMKRIDARYRTLQKADGGWAYNSIPPSPGETLTGTTAAMTCAGLLGLALAHGSSAETTLRAGVLPGPGNPRPRPAGLGTARDLLKDPVVRKGLLTLGSFLGKPFEGPEEEPSARVAATGKGYYFLFSLERVGVAYGLDTIGDKSWYDWGADILLQRQNRDGSWTGEYAKAGSDTSFALLFLRRANLATDLTAIIKAGRHDLHAGTTEDLQRTKPRAGVGDTTPPPAPADTARPAPAPAASAAAGQLGDELVNADAGKQDAVIAKLRDSKGAQYTDALAYAIHKLDGLAKSKARDALADRLTRMSARTLTDKVQDDDPEVRRAAALAIAMKDEKDLVPRLIERLEDQETAVSHAAHAALKSLTRQDFGPERDASRADVARAVAAWKDWWSKNGGK
jgi:hypothetical protein